MFSRKKKRRERRPTFLEVQTDKGEAARPLGEGISILFLVLIVLALLFWLMFLGIKSVARQSYTSNERYRLVAGHVQFQTSPGGLVNAERAMDIAGIQPDGNLFDFDIKKARQNLLAMPAIKEASLKRRLPDGLDIRIEERTGVAVLPGRVPLLVDHKGLVIRARTPLDPNVPVLRGLHREAVKVGGTISNGHGGDALNILSIVHESPFLPRFLQIEEINVSDPEIVVVSLRNGLRVLLPRSRFESHLNRTAQFIDEGLRGRKLNTLDFTSGRMFARYE